MKKLILLLALFVSGLSIAQNYSRAKILTGSEGLQTLAEMGIAIDHGTVKRSTFFISDFSTEEINTIRNAGFTVEILIDDVQAYYINQNKNPQEVTKNVACSNSGESTFIPVVPSNFNLGSMAGFFTYQEFLDEIDAMHTLYPNLISAKAPISTFTTAQGRPIYYLKISDNPTVDEAEPEVLYTSIHHAREPNSLSEVIFYMWYLLENYATSDEIQFLVNESEQYFVPMINPDGYNHNVQTNPNGGGMWRKNRRLNSGGSYGVDLNRNYSYQWGTTGTSPNQSNDTYPGTGPFSEPETQAIKWLCEQRDFEFAFNAHTYAAEILHPVGSTTAEFAVDHNYFQAFTGYMVQYNGYANRKSSDLYPASGDSDDYMYKVDTVVKPKIFAMTPEVSNTAGGFWPATNQITGICQDMVFPNLMLTHLTHKYYAVSDTDPSSIASVSGNFNHTAYRLGTENGPVTVSITPLIGIATVGTGVSHDLPLMQTATGAISYTLDANIQFGSVIKYVLNTNYGAWTKRDTITKTYGSITTQFLDQGNATTNWTGNWGTTTSTFVSPSSSFTDSPSGQYSNNISRAYRYNTAIDLTNVTEAGVTYYAKWDIENSYDYCQFQVSTDNGATWQGQCGLYTNLGDPNAGGVQPNGPVYDGTQTSWVLEEISLSDYIGSIIQVRFLLASDGAVRGDGFYFDDFEVLYNIDYTAIGENTQNALHVLPNPASDEILMSFDKAIASGTISCYALNGQEVMRLAVNELTNKVKIDCSTWKDGMYQVVLETADGFIKPEKIIVIH